MLKNSSHKYDFCRPDCLYVKIKIPSQTIKTNILIIAGVIENGVEVSKLEYLLIISHKIDTISPDRRAKIIVRQYKKRIYALFSVFISELFFIFNSEFIVFLIE